MSLIDSLSDFEEWLEFYNYKKESLHLSRHEDKELLDFIESKKYLRLTEKSDCLVEDDSLFDYPQKIFINKMSTGKKRVVYKFPDTEAYVLKLLCWLMKKYDNKFSDNCYSFRSGRSVKDVCMRLKKCKQLEKKYSVKVDVHDYFNSIPAEKLIECLEDFIDDDEKLLEFLKRLLRQDKAYIFQYEKKDYKQRGKKRKDSENRVVQKTVVEENRGAMAGCPLGGFFANLYLRDVDLFFEEYCKQLALETEKDDSLLYFRYSDDIIIFADSEEQRNEALEILNSKIIEHGLAMNPEKYFVTEPGEKWDFLGISYFNGEFDLSDSSVRKIKGKIKRKAKQIWSWRNRKNQTYEKAAKILVNKFNNLWFGKISDEEAEDENIADDLFNWRRWYFPIITTVKSLEEIDHYFQEYLRFLNSGRHYKGNYSITYDQLKRIGYRSLVHEFYKYRIKK